MRRPPSPKRTERALYFDALDQVPADLADDFRPTPDDTRNAQRSDEKRRNKEAAAITRVTRSEVRRG